MKDAKNKEIPNSRKYKYLKASTEEYFSINLAVDTKTFQYERNSKKYEVDYKYTEIYLVTMIIHETIHALIMGVSPKELSLKFPKDENHNLSANKRNLMINALTEYVAANGLNYTAQDIDDLSWHSIEQSDQFKEHFTNLAINNGTTYDEEVSKWSTRKSKLATEHTSEQREVKE